jgi:hypothetical protein
VINLNKDWNNIDNSSFFENKKINIITNLGQIFEIIKNDNVNNKNDKKYFSNNIICLGKHSNNNNNIKIKMNNISKYPENNDGNDNDNDNHRNSNIYDFIGNNKDEIQNDELFLPLSEEEESTNEINENIENNKFTSFLNKRIRDSNFNNALHQNLFDENINENINDNNLFK